MTRKDYEAIAAIIRQADSKPHNSQKIYITEALCQLFQHDNPRFSRHQFLTACEMSWLDD